MKKTIAILIVGCLTVHCQPPPERPKKDHHLRLENLIYSVALSSFQLAYQMDVKRKDHILSQVRKQLEEERENSAIARKALEERIAVLIEEKSQAFSGNEDSEDGMTLQIHGADAPKSAVESVPAESLSLEEKLTQLEALVFGEEGSTGLLFRIKFLKEKWALALSPSSTAGLDVPVAELTEEPAPGSPETVDNENRVKSLFHFFQGEGHYPGVHSQVTELEEALSSIGITEDQNETLIKTVEQFVAEQKNSVPEGASVEDRLARLESLVHGSEEWEGIKPWVVYLKTQEAGLNETPAEDSSSPVLQTDDRGSEG